MAGRRLRRVPRSSPSPDRVVADEQGQVWLGDSGMACVEMLTYLNSSRSQRPYTVAFEARSRVATSLTVSNRGRVPRVPLSCLTGDKIGLDVAVEALRDHRRRRGSVDPRDPDPRGATARDGHRPALFWRRFRRVLAAAHRGMRGASRRRDARVRRCDCAVGGRPGLQASCGRKEQPAGPPGGPRRARPGRSR